MEDVPRIVLTRPSRQDKLHNHRLPDGAPRTRLGGAKHTRVAEQRLQEQARERSSDQLGDDITGHAPPREISTARERNADRRIEVRPRDRAHEEDDCQHHQAWRGHRRRSADLPVAHRVDATPAGCHEHEQERSQNL